MGASCIVTINSEHAINSKNSEETFFASAPPTKWKYNFTLLPLNKILKKNGSNIQTGLYNELRSSRETAGSTECVNTSPKLVKEISLF